MTRPGGASKPKKLWMLNHYAATSQQAGGSRHADLARALSERNWDVEIFACSFDHVTRQYTVPTSWRKPVITQTSGQTLIHWLHSTPYFDNSSRRYLNMLVFSAILMFSCLFRRTKPNSVLGSSGHLLTPFVGWIIAKRYRAKFLMEVRDLWPDSLIQLGLTSKPIIWILRGLEGFLYRHSDVIVGVSEGIVAGIARNGGDPSKTILISHGIEPNPQRQEIIDRRAQIRKKLGWGEELVVLWAGSMEPFNALDVVVSAAEQFDGESVRVVLLGGGSSAAALREQAATNPVVTIAPPVPRMEAFEWMVAADAGLLVAKPFESFTGTRPRKIFDYMAARLPILCFVPGEASQVVQDAKAGLVRDWAAPENVEKTIRWCLANSDELRDMGLNGETAVETTYSLLNGARLLDESLT